MDTSFSDIDKKFMEIALKEAVQAYEEGNYPCGAVLTVDNQILSSAHNLKEARKDRVSHAEMLLYIENSVVLRQAKKENKRITMYTTLEPCLMCYGAAVIHRVNRIVASSPDPYGNMSKVKDAKLGSFYSHESLPSIEYGLLFDKTHEVTVKFLEQKGDEEALELIRLLTEIRV